MNDNLVDDLFNKPKNFKMGILSTFSFNVDFFEKYLLQLEGLGNCSDICIFTDRGTYNSLFEKTINLKQTKINKRYLLVPIDVQGVYHPKLYILASDKLVLIGIGSSNLTREGIANNLELVSVFEVSDKDKSNLGLLKDGIEFYQKLAILSKSKSAIEMVSRFTDYVAHLFSGEIQASIKLIHNLDEDILAQIKNSIDLSSVTKVQVISPFFDNTLEPYKYLRQNCPDATIDIYVQQGKSNFPKDTMNTDDQNLNLYVFLNEERYIHGKSIIFKTDSNSYLLTGSANFTSAALLSKQAKSNIEVSLFGPIENSMSKSLLKPGITRSQIVTKLSDVHVIESVENDLTSSDQISDWLIEVTYEDHHLETSINKKDDLTPTHLILNDDETQKYVFNTEIETANISESDIVYARLIGYDAKEKEVESSLVWVINLDQRSQNRVRGLRISHPDQVLSAFQELLMNGTERELIDYLLAFDIPLNLTFGLAYSPRAAMSKGNLFGELSDHHHYFKYMDSNVYEASRLFLERNFGKMKSHYENPQLDKLDNFMLIYGSTFNMIQAFGEFIWKENNKKVLDADKWCFVRRYFDLMLEYIWKILSFVWVQNDEEPSFEMKVNAEINSDKMNVLGNIRSLKHFIVCRNYESIYRMSLVTSLNLIKRTGLYLDKLKVKTTLGSIIDPPPPLCNNGFYDVYILKIRAISEMIRHLQNKYNLWRTI